MDTIIRSHKIRLKPTEDQKEHLERAFAAARYAWNWGKEILDVEYDINRIQYRETETSYKYTHARRLKKLFNRVKPPWVQNKTASATQEAFDDLQRAVGRFFDIRKGKISINLKRRPDGSVKGRKDGRAHGWLNWRSKKKHNSFRVTNVYLKFDGAAIRYNVNVGYIDMCEELRFNGKIMNATFSYDGEWYWVSVQVQIPKPEIETRPGVVGIDLGIKYLAVTSDGQIIDNPKAYYTAKAKLRRLQRRLDRQRRANNPDCYNDDSTAIKGKRPNRRSNRMAITERKIRKLHSRIKNIRRNSQHHLTAAMASEYGLIVIEDLNVNGMLKNKKLAKAIADAGFFEVRRQLEYKSEYYNGLVGVVDTWFPSSKLCSNCGEKKLDMPLNIREWTCEHCGSVNHRDYNAAKNLEIEGIRMYTTIAP